MISAILLLAFWLIIVAIDDFRLKKKLKDALLNMESLNKYKTAYELSIEKTTPNVQIMQLQHQADMLKFCFLCPLYQDKVREDKQQNLQREQE